MEDSDRIEITKYFTKALQQCLKARQLAQAAGQEEIAEEVWAINNRLSALILAVMTSKLER